MGNKNVRYCVQSQMVARRSIEMSSGWYRAYGNHSIYRCGGSAGVTPVSHLPYSVLTKIDQTVGTKKTRAD